MLHTHLQRCRLVDAINEPYQAPVTIITAPAGYGKTILAEQWAQSRNHTVGFVTLNEQSNTPERIFSQMLVAIRDAEPDTDIPEIDDLPLDAMLNALQTVSASGLEFTIILDDYHLIQNQDVHDDINTVLSNLPRGTHVVILSRTQPPLSLGRLRLQGKLRHLNETDLCFTPEEVRKLVSARHLSARQTSALTSRTDGWIAGIQLALASLDMPGDQRQQRFDSAIESLSEQHWLNEYIIEEVLDTLPADLRWFVMGTSILTELDPDLCNAVLDIDNSEEYLLDLVQRVVFVSTVGTTESLLTYHRLFAECVERISHRSFTRKERRIHHCRAALWREQHGQRELAIEHAIQGEEWGQAARLLNIVCQSLIDTDRMHSAIFWLSKLPSAQRHQHDELAYWYVKSLLHTGQFDAARRELEILEPRWRSSDIPVLRGYAAACNATFAAFAGDDDLTLHLWYQALHYIPIEKTIDRLHAWSLVHQFEFLRGNDEVAEQAYQQASWCTKRLPADQHWWINHVQLDRANHRALRADLVTAEQLYRYQLENQPASSRSFEAKIRYRLAAIYLEWNELDRALSEAQKITAGLENYPIHAWHPEAMLVVAQVHMARGDTDQATAALQQVFAMCDVYGGHNNTVQRAKALQASAWLTMEKPGLSREWAAQYPAHTPEWERIYGEGDIRITQLQMLIADNQPAEASQRARLYIEEAISIKHWVAAIDFNVWDAVAQKAMGNTEAARNALRAALKLGIKGTFIRSFSPPGHDLGSLLRTIRSGLADEAVAYIDRILDSLGLENKEDRTLQKPTPDTLSNPLTAREQEVLEYLYSGSTNQEIADHLFITERTVKKHVGNILAKLGAANRTSAVTRGLQAGLLM